jgi:tryptophan-rich sensory protein
MTAAIQIWTISKGGPVLASIYLPLQTILVALMTPIVFGEEFFLGGYVLIIQVTSISICFLIILLMTKYE